MRSPLQTSSLVVCVLFFLSGCKPDAGPGAGRVYPHKPIKVIVPFEAGGGSDTFARILQDAIRKHHLLPQPLVIINVPGTGGAVGSRRVKEALADGYTILDLHEGILTAKYSGNVSFGPEAFEPIAATGRSGMIVCVAEDAPYRDLMALLKTAQERPGEILLGANLGAPSHFTGRRLEAAMPGAAFRYVQTGGGARRFASLKGGHIDATAFSLAEYRQFKGGGLRALAYLGDERAASEPGISTAREQGIDVVSANYQCWWAPRGTPADRVALLADALGKAMATPEVRARLDELQMDPVYLQGEEFRREIAAWEHAISEVRVPLSGTLPSLAPAVIGLTVILGAALGIQRVRALRKRRPATTTGPLREERRSRRWPWQWQRMGTGIIAVLLTVIYVSAMQRGWLGFLVATMLYVPLCGFLLSDRTIRRIPVLLAAGLVTGWGCHYLFTSVFVIDLP